MDKKLSSNIFRGTFTCASKKFSTHTWYAGRLWYVLGKGEQNLCGGNDISEYGPRYPTLQPALAMTETIHFMCHE